MNVMTAARAIEAAQPFSEIVETERSPVTLPDALAGKAVRVIGEADPNILARIVQPMVKLDIMPRSFSVTSDPGGRLLAEIDISGVEARAAERLESTLRSVIGVVSVELVG